MSNDNKSTVYIEYNPYTVETKIEIDGQPISNESSLKKCNNKRLQYWLEKNKNWQGIIEELRRYVNNAEDINITFKGRKIDFDDLKLTVDKYNKNNSNSKIILNFLIGKEEKNILENINDIFEEIKSGPIEELKTEELKSVYEEVKSSKFKISVIATMSSGKSTLINSLIGYELLPSKNMACTATVARITDNNNKVNKFKAVCRDSNENIIYDKKVISLKDIEKYNDDEKVTYIDIEGNIPGISSDKLNLLLYDTPGPNNSRNERHGELTQSVIEDKKKGVVLYVLNATQFGINDDADLLKDISFQMKRGGKQSKDRFIFVINKCDELDTEKGESVDSLLECVKEYLKEYDIEEPNLFAVTAQGAKLIRMYKNGTSFTRKERKELDGIVEDFNDLDGYHFEKKCTLSESCKENIDRKLRYAIENNDKYEEALIHTGVLCIEEAINEYLEKYAYPIKIQDAIKDLEIILKNKKMETGFYKELLDNKDNIKNVKNQINEARKKIKEINESDKFERLEIDNDIFKRSKDKFSQEIKELVREEWKNPRIIKEKADGYKKKFESTMIELERKLILDINRDIKLNVINEGENLIEKYNNIVSKICNKINIDNFNIENIIGVKIIEIEDFNFDHIFYENSKEEDKYEEKRKKNYDKKWYKPWTWFEDEYYYVEEKIGKETYIDFIGFIDQSISGLQIHFNDIVDEAFNEVVRRINKIKEYFIKKEFELKEIIDNNLNEIQENIKDIENGLKAETAEEVEKIKNISSEQKKNYKWLCDINKRIKDILE